MLQEETNDLAPPAAELTSTRTSWFMGPLTPLEAADLVTGPLLVDPVEPRQLNPKPKSCSLFTPSSDQLITHKGSLELFG